MRTVPLSGCERTSGFDACVFVLHPRSMDEVRNERLDDSAAQLAVAGRGERGGSAPRRQKPPRGVPRWFWAGLVLIAVAMGAAGYWLLVPHNGAVKLTPPKKSGRPLSFAGSFPAASEPGLKGPLGIAVIGERVFVSESDAGLIREFGENGARAGSIALTKANGAARVYPADLAAVGDDRLAVVDTAASRVLLVAIDDGAETLVIGAEEPATAPKQPTAVAGLDDGVAVADATDHVVKVYGRDGRYLRTLGSGLAPKLGFVGGMSLVGGLLYVSDSNAGRVVVLDPTTGALARILPDKMTLPRGLCGASGGRLLVVQTFGPRVAVLATDGSLLDSIPGSKRDTAVEAQPILPKAVAWMASTQRAYVTDAGDGRVRVYNLLDATKR